MGALNGAVSSLAWSRDGSRIAVSFTASRVAVIDARTWKLVAERGLPTPGDLEWSPDGREIVVATEFLDVRFMDPEDLSERARLTLGWADAQAGSDGQPAMGSVSDLAYCSDGSLAVFALTDHTLIARGGGGRLEGWRRSATRESPLRCWVSFSPDGHSLATNDGPCLCVIEPATRAERMVRAGEMPVGAVAWSPDGARIAVRSGEGVGLWRAGSLALEGSLRVGPGGGEPLWCADSVHLGLVAQEGLELWSTQSRRLVARASAAGARVMAAAADPRERRFVYGTDDGALGVLGIG